MMESLVVVKLVTFAFPETSKVAEGVTVPIPSLLLVLSQKKLELSSEKMPLKINGIEPLVNVLAPVPPRDMDSSPCQKRV